MSGSWSASWICISSRSSWPSTSSAFSIGNYPRQSSRRVGAANRDSVNIGNARLYGLEEDLALSSNQFQVAVSILFVTYLLFEVPSNLVLKLFTPRRWIAFIAFTWGLIATMTGLVESYGGLIAVRLLLGVVEAGLFPGLNVYLTFFYSKHELALRVGYLFVSAAIAGALGGLLAYGIGHLDGVQGMSGWRWIMIIEGIPSVLLGIITYFALPNDSQSAYFLSKEEKALMEVRRRREYGNTVSSQQFNKEDMNRAFTDWKVWVFSIAQFGVDTMLYGTSCLCHRYRHGQLTQQAFRPSSLPSLTTSAIGPRQRFNSSPFRATSSVPRPTWSLRLSLTARSSAVSSVSFSEPSASLATASYSVMLTVACITLAAFSSREVCTSLSACRSLGYVLRLWNGKI